MKVTLVRCSVISLFLVSLIFLTGTPALADGPYSISGTVTDAGYEPLSGVVVSALAVNSSYLPAVLRGGSVSAATSSDEKPAPLVAGGLLSSAEVYSTTTGAGGTYSLSGLPAGRYWVTAARSGLSFYPTRRVVILNQDRPTRDFTEWAMVSVPTGSFQMGCDPNHNGGYGCPDDELPLHSLSMTGFQIDKYLVTNAQYARCVADSACSAPASNSSHKHSSYYDNSTYAAYPVIHVSWNSALAYCTWAGKRLPTEAEWEYAARGGGVVRAYPWGDGTPGCSLANSGSDYEYSACQGDTSQVGSLPGGASPYGALDMAGNVWEWVNDWYAPDYYASSPSSNPPGPASGSYRAKRGGSYYYLWNDLRTAGRDNNPPTDQWEDTGFRCAATVN